MRTVTVSLAFLLFVFSSGCDNTRQRISQAEEVTKLKQQSQQLENQLQQSKQETEQVKKQMSTLAKLDPNVRVEHLYNLQSIKITRYTAFYDKDNDGKKEKLLVYLQPIDEQNDVVKATGAVDVQLWDLNKTGGNALISQWHITPAELKKCWVATLITINYRLVFDVAGIIDNAKGDLTVKVTFTDYVSGKVFTEQKVIKR